MTTSPAAAPTGADLALAAASAAAAVLPSVEPLTAAGTQPGTADVVAAFAGAAIAELESPLLGRIAVLVGKELTTALASRASTSRRRPSLLWTPRPRPWALRRGRRGPSSSTWSPPTWGRSPQCH